MQAAEKGTYYSIGPVGRPIFKWRFDSAVTVHQLSTRRSLTVNICVCVPVSL